MRAARWVLVWLAATVALVAPALPALAEYPPAGEELAVTDTAPAPGDEVLVTGSGFQSGSTVTLTFESTPVFLATARVGDDGRFAVWVRIPADAHPGWHKIRARGTGVDGLPRELTIPIFVTGAAPAPRPADAGAGTWDALLPLGLWPGVVVLLVGATLWTIRRRHPRGAAVATPGGSEPPES